jgi:hypothetical protein
MRSSWLGSGIRLVLVALLGVAAGLGFPLLLREGNPLSLMWASVQVEARGEAAVPIDRQETRWLAPAGDDQPILEAMAERGWTFVDRLGGMILFERDGERLQGTVRPLTRRYKVYEFSRTP